jgi:hypothetical protein
MEDEQLHESFEGSPFEESSVSGNVISNVKLLSSVSRNGRTYSEQAMKDAQRLYENVAVYFDHPTSRELKERGGTRKVRDLAGKVLNPRRGAGEIRGDIQLIDVAEGGDASPRAFIAALAEQMPDMVGFSHRAAGKLTKGKAGAGDVVESLSHVYAHELVTDPATTNGLFESLQTTDEPSGKEENEMEIKDLTLEGLRKERPDLIKAVQAEIEESAEMTALKAENTRLKDAQELRENEDKERKHKEMVAELLKEAKLPEKVVTDTFKAQLEEAKDKAAVEALIADRKLLAENSKGKGPRSVEVDMDEAFRASGTFEDVTDDHLEEAVKLFH